MAYVSTETTKRVRAELKQAYPNLKFSVSKKDGTLRVRIMSGDIDFRDVWEDIPQSKQYWKRFNYPKPHFEGYVDINTYHPDSYNPKYTDLFKGIIDIMKGDEWFDKSDPQIDYFNTAYYMKLSVGKWNKDYQYTGVPRMSDLFGRMRAEDFDAEALVIPDVDSIPQHKIYPVYNRLNREGIKYRHIEGDYGAEEFGAEGEVECNDCGKSFDLSETKTWIDDERYCADCLDFQRKQALKDDEALQREEENERIVRAIRRDRGDEYYAEGEDITLKDSAKLGFGLGAGLLGFRVALFGVSALVGGFILNRNK